MPKGTTMESHDQDLAAISHIQKLAAEEHKLFESKTRTDADTKRLKHLQVQLDQCWDLLRQRRAARETGHDPKDAQLRPPIVVENYKG
jgi:site-specific recombinase